MKRDQEPVQVNTIRHLACGPLSFSCHFLMSCPFLYLERRTAVPILVPVPTSGGERGRVCGAWMISLMCLSFGKHHSAEPLDVVGPVPSGMTSRHALMGWSSAV